MNIDVTKIVQDKIDSLQAEGIVEKAITETFEKTIVKAVTDSLDSYELRKNIEKKMTEQVSKVVADLDFQCYNSFMIEKMSQILNEICREDICEKVEKKFKDLFLCQTKEIKLSSIFEKFSRITSYYSPGLNIFINTCCSSHYCPLSNFNSHSDKSPCPNPGLIT